MLYLFAHLALFIEAVPQAFVYLRRVVADS